jgi:hypothetical protein
MTQLRPKRRGDYNKVDRYNNGWIPINHTKWNKGILVSWDSATRNSVNATTNVIMSLFHFRVLNWVESKSNYLEKKQPGGCKHYISIYDFFPKKLNHRPGIPLKVPYVVFSLVEHSDGLLKSNHKNFINQFWTQWIQTSNLVGIWPMGVFNMAENMKTLRKWHVHRRVSVEASNLVSTCFEVINTFQTDKNPDPPSLSYFGLSWGL